MDYLALEEIVSFCWWRIGFELSTWGKVKSRHARALGVLFPDIKLKQFDIALLGNLNIYGSSALIRFLIERTL